MILQLEERYGIDFMPPFLALRRERHGARTSVSIGKVLALFAEVSGDPGIWAWFAASGTTVHPSASAQ